MRFKFAAQMYSVRKAFEKDCEGTIKKLKEIGFDYVQVDGMRGHDEKLVAEMLVKYDLKPVGLHIKHDRFFNDLDGIIEEAYLFGCKTIYDKYIDDEEQNEEGYIATKKVLIEAARKLSPLGFRIGVHNPEYDYNNKVNGRKVLDYITDPVDGICIYAEPDTYWMSVAEENPVESIKKYSGRMPLIHCKDIDLSLDLNDMDANLREVGSGDVDFKSILKYGIENGVEYFCIEQDSSKGDMFESLKMGLDHLTKLAEEIETE